MSFGVMFLIVEGAYFSIHLRHMLVSMLAQTWSSNIELSPPVCSEDLEQGNDRIAQTHIWLSRFQSRRAFPPIPLRIPGLLTFPFLLFGGFLWGLWFGGIEG